MLLNMNNLIQVCTCTIKCLAPSRTLRRLGILAVVTTSLAACAGQGTDRSSVDQSDGGLVVAKANDAAVLVVSAHNADYPFTHRKPVWTTGRDSDIDVMPADRRQAGTPVRRTAAIGHDGRKDFNPGKVVPADRVDAWKGRFDSPQQAMGPVEHAPSQTAQAPTGDSAVVTRTASGQPIPGQPIPGQDGHAPQQAVAVESMPAPRQQAYSVDQGDRSGGNPSGTPQSLVLRPEQKPVATRPTVVREEPVVVAAASPPARTAPVPQKREGPTAVQRVAAANGNDNDQPVKRQDVRKQQAQNPKKHQAVRTADVDFTSLGRISSEAPLVIGAPDRENLAAPVLAEPMVDEDQRGGTKVAARMEPSARVETGPEANDANWTSPLLAHVETNLDTYRRDHDVKPRAEVATNGGQPVESRREKTERTEQAKLAKPKTSKRKELAAQIRFDKGSSLLSPSDHAILGQVAQRHKDKGGTVLVIGHGDKASKGDNDRISAKRAEAVADALVSLGVDPKNLRSEGVRGEASRGGLISQSAQGAEIFLARGQ